MNRLLDDLNEAQREAVATTEGPLLVIAGAGSGKTRVLTRRLAHLLVQRLAQPYQILAVTFTNKAAGEMKARVAQLMGSGLEQMQVSTFHSFCARLLRREAAALGYSTNFTIYDQGDQLTLMRNCLKELGFSDKQFPPKGQVRRISDAKSKLISADKFAAEAKGYFESRTAELYLMYQRRLRECDAMDFDDLLFNAVWVLKHTDGIGDRYRQQFRYLMVDEYQDTNHIQYLLLKHLLGDHQNICVVGDEDQSIYGWRGADIRNILEFEQDFPGAKIIRLEQNYRSTQVILNAASAVIENNQMRKGKKLWTETKGGEPVDLLMTDRAEDEASAILQMITSAKAATGLKEIVILYRTNAQSRPFEEQLRRNNIPYQIVGGISFYQRKEIKDLLGYLKLIANAADDVSFERIINYPKRGIGDVTVAQIMALARERKTSCYAIAKDADTIPELSGKLARLQGFVELIEKYRERKESEPIDLLVQDLVVDINLLPELQAEDPVTGQTKVENIEAFIEGTAQYARTNAEARIENYLAEISLYTDVDNYREIDDKVTLMTLHTAKGLEYHTVFIAGLEEGLFPLQRATSEPWQLEEERRLFYVGATRACRKLYLSTASSRFRFGEVQSIPSRFIKEIPKELLHIHDLRSHRPVAPAAPARVSTTDEPEGRHYVYDEEEVMRPGRIVSHPTFGRGKILKAEGYGDSLRLEIMFTGLGVKKIMAKFAKLTVVG